ncbi:hypothetical protein BGZ49_008072 [Haplosporangium sp. Z 27]|nr:hypothetical protein BGZ49_008072 [Haplosporangium sp. Z 27]
MVRHEKIEGPLEISWGYDDALFGYFLSVVDKHLEWNSEASEEVNLISSKICEHGGGCYLELNTYPFDGFGYRVSKDTIFTYMKRYGIDPPKVRSSGNTILHVHGGDETPELRIDPDYINRQRARIEEAIKTSKNRPVIIVLSRIDRTIQELSVKYDVPILRDGKEPPEEPLSTIFFLPQELYAKDFKQCVHPDCCIPERDEVKLKKCSRCKKATYCSQTCQTAHWKEHKKECQASDTGLPMQ